MFRSEVFPDFFSEKINYSDRIMFIGSCFAENIGLKLYELKFPILLNPFGIIYNPVSIAQSLEYIMENKSFKDEDIELYNEKWISFNHHGKFSSPDKSEILQNINNELTKATDVLRQASHLFITFGTSWIYKLKKTSKIVANCHKLPANEFEHYSLSVEEIKNIYLILIEKLYQFNDKLKIIFTVSPVRHWKNGPVQNQYSKSVLIVSIHELMKKFDFVSYFPSYEIMMDDLRDYRFYTDDLFHPNQMGINYIFEKFKECYFSAETHEISSKTDKIIKSAKHRVFYPKTISYKKFIENSMAQIKEMRSKYPNLDFEKEFEHFEMELQCYFKD